VDAVLGVVGGDTQARTWALIRRGGVLESSVGVQGQEQAEAVGVRAVDLMAGQDDRVLTTRIDLVAEGIVRLRISSLPPIDDTVEAHRQIETGRTQGKIVLELGQPPF
jgi:NADPH:quinone reductase-like Zn-dependent oxidoreductase